MEVYIVKKNRKCTVVEGKQTMQADFSTNEGVFATQEEADEYITKRKAAKDRDDRGCTFSTEPWYLDLSRSDHETVDYGLEEATKEEEQEEREDI